MKLSQQINLYLLLILFFSCQKHKENLVEPSQEYIKYIDTKTINTDLVPLDMVATSDGYLMLGSSPTTEGSYHQTYLLKVDKEGKYVWDYLLAEQFLNPVSDILEREGEYFIVCMDKATGTHIVKIDGLSPFAVSVKYLDAIQLPVHASLTNDGGFLIQNCNLGDNWTGLTKINRNFESAWSVQYTVTQPFGEELSRHVKREIPPLPFVTGQVDGGTYFFNGYYDSNFSCVFVNAANGEPMNGLIGGDRSFAALRNIVAKGNNQFALVRYDRTGINYLLPTKEINIQSSTFTASTELGGIKFSEIENRSRMMIRKLSLEGKEVLAFVANTKNKGIGIYLFESSGERLLGSKFLNLETPCEFGGIATASDGGLAVFATTYIANRFARPCLFKLNKEEVKKLAGL